MQAAALRGVYGAVDLGSGQQPGDEVLGEPRFVRPAIVLSGAIVLYALAGFLLVPWIARGQIVKQARSVLGREATVE